MDKGYLKRVIGIVFVGLIFCNIAFAETSNPKVKFSQEQSTEKYKNLENIPGYVRTDNFVDYLQDLYGFGISITAILAVFMIGVGAFKYIVFSAGNAGKMKDGKDNITSAIIGLVIALGAYLILFIINPDLLSGTISDNSTGVDSNISSQNTSGENNGSSSGSTGNMGTGTCTPVTSGVCSVENLEKTCFGSNAKKASCICNIESGGNEKSKSGTDICKNDSQKRAFSMGLFQIKLSVHKMGSLNSPAAFSTTNTNCRIVDESLYNSSVTKATTASENIAKACELSKNGISWTAWGKPNGSWGANSKCGF